jgi:hypothetical protein
VSADPPAIDFPGGRPHVYEEAVEASVLPEEWKKLFKDVLAWRDDVLAAIPSDAHAGSYLVPP